MVLVDTPPVLAVSDPLVVTPHLDGTVFVCQANKTRTDAVQRAVTQLRSGNVRILGVVINRQKGRGANPYYYGYGVLLRPRRPRQTRPERPRPGQRPPAGSPDPGLPAGIKIDRQKLIQSAARVWYYQTPHTNTPHPQVEADPRTGQASPDIPFAYEKSCGETRVPDTTNRHPGDNPRAPGSRRRRLGELTSRRTPAAPVLAAPRRSAPSGQPTRRADSRQNLIANPSVEQDLTGWSTYTSDPELTVEYRRDNQFGRTAPPASGKTFSTRRTPRKAPPPTGSTPSPSTHHRGAAPSPPPWTPAPRPPTSRRCRPRVLARRRHAAQRGSRPGTVGLPPNAWSRHQIDGVQIPEGTTQIRVIGLTHVAQAAAVGVIWFDAFVLEAGAVAGPYVDPQASPAAPSPVSSPATPEPSPTSSPIPTRPPATSTAKDDTALPPTPEPTVTSSPSSTPRAATGATDVPRPTATASRTATSTSTPEPPTPTPVPPTPTRTNTPPPTMTATSTATSTATAQPSPTATNSPSPEPTSTPTNKATVEPTASPTRQPTETASPTSTLVRPKLPNTNRCSNGNSLADSRADRDGHANCDSDSVAHQFADAAAHQHGNSAAVPPQQRPRLRSPQSLRHRLRQSGQRPHPHLPLRQFHRHAPQPRALPHRQRPRQLQFRRLQWRQKFHRLQPRRQPEFRQPRRRSPARRPQPRHPPHRKPQRRTATATREAPTIAPAVVPTVTPPPASAISSPTGETDPDVERAADGNPDRDPTGNVPRQSGAHRRAGQQGRAQGAREVLAPRNGGPRALVAGRLQRHRLCRELRRRPLRGHRRRQASLAIQHQRRLPLVARRSRWRRLCRELRRELVRARRVDRRGEVDCRNRPRRIVTDRGRRHRLYRQRGRKPVCVECS